MAKDRIKLKKTGSSTPIQDRSVLEVSSALKGKKIALAVCGGIGAIEVVKIARELRRHGAALEAFMSPQAKKFITPLSVEWACGTKPILKAGAKVEYLESFDAVLVVPATLHTLSKASLGLTQTVVDLVIANQLGSHKPVFFVPAMNQQLWEHPSLLESQKRLKSWGAIFYPAIEEESRIKVPDAKVLVNWLIEKMK